MKKYAEAVGVSDLSNKDIEQAYNLLNKSKTSILTPASSSTQSSKKAKSQSGSKTSAQS
jgi:hypothetical protein